MCLFVTSLYCTPKVSACSIKCWSCSLSTHIDGLFALCLCGRASCTLRCNPNKHCSKFHGWGTINVNTHKAKLAWSCFAKGVDPDRHNDNPSTLQVQGESEWSSKSILSYFPSFTKANIWSSHPAPYAQLFGLQISLRQLWVLHRLIHYLWHQVQSKSLQRYHKMARGQLYAGRPTQQGVWCAADPTGEPARLWGWSDWWDFFIIKAIDWHDFWQLYH